MGVDDRGRRAFVTGLGGGIGRAVEAELRRRGMDVAGMDLVPTEAGVQGDVTDEPDVRRALADAERRLGGLDVIVNTVGISGRTIGDGPVDRCSDEAWATVMNVNVRSVFLVCRAVIPRLGPGASIVNMSSVLGLRGGEAGLFETHAYAASKGAVISLTKAMAASYAPRGIRVNAVAPGLVRTPMSERARADEAVGDLLVRRQSLVGGALEPASVASAVGFLASVHADGVTGVVLPVDGGWTVT